MTSAELLIDAFGRIREGVEQVVEDLEADDLNYRIDDEANSIAWLIWHLTRVQDDHIADLANTDQVWTAQRWADQFALPFPVTDTGYGHTSAQVATVHVTAGGLLTEYHGAVHEQTIRYIRDINDTDLDDILDATANPPITRGVRLISIVSDDLQHVGQAAFIRGIRTRR